MPRPPHSPLASVSTVLVLVRAVAAVVAIGTQVLLARLLVPADLGLYFLAASGASVVAMIAVVGYPSIVVRFVARYQARGRETLLALFVRRTRREVLIAALIMATCLALGAALFAGDRATVQALWLAAALVPVLAFGRHMGAFANAKRMFHTAFLPDLIGRPLLLVVGLAALWAFGLPLNAVSALGVFALAAIAAVTVQAGLVLPRLPASAPRTGSGRRVARLWRSAALPLILLSLITAFFADIGIVAAAPFLDREQLALFAICLKTALVVGFVVQVLHQVALPEMADALEAGAPTAARGHVLRANRLAVAATLVAFLGALAFGPFYLGLFGQAYREGSMLLAVLIAGQVVRAWFGPATYVLTLAGRSMVNSALSVGVIAVLGGANVLLIPAFGLVGAGLAASGAIALWAAAAAMAAPRRGGISAHGIAAIRPHLRAEASAAPISAAARARTT